MELWAAQASTLVAFFLSMLGACLAPLRLVARHEAAFTGRRYESGLALANCLSAGVFLATFFVGLLPEVRRQFAGLLLEARVLASFPVTEFVVLLGFFLSVALEQLLLRCRPTHDAHSPPHPPSRDVPAADDDPVPPPPPPQHHHHHHHHQQQAHGHSHAIGSAVTSEGGVRAGLLLLSLGVHSLFEGMTLGLQTRVPRLLNLFVGVWVHEFLVAFAVGVTLARMRLRARPALQLAVLFSASIPAGQALGLALLLTGGGGGGGVLSTLLQALAAGTFVHVTFLEIIPEGLLSGAEEEEGEGCANKAGRLLCLTAGFVLIALVPAFLNTRDAHEARVADEYARMLQLKDNWSNQQ